MFHCAILTASIFLNINNHKDKLNFKNELDYKLSVHIHVIVPTYKTDYCWTWL